MMMKKSFFFLLLVLSLSANAQGAKVIPNMKSSLNCRVVGISDGDTFKCLTNDKTQVRVRLNSIDAPEKSQVFGQRAKNALSNMIFNKTVSLSFKNTDRYGRIIADVSVAGNHVNKSMIVSGFAWVYREYVPAAERSEYLELEAQAKAARRGLWADPNPIYPSQFRRKK
ncbi:thermonuclease family protein [Kingella kingae]|uniref:thermonuclease family protein n=1 Tax=Kingella kingae TaxID=504 RepID=UPI00254A90DC|nr:thermonuclease family protein [Kingella kingae]MDK4565260.1 thermonuclease family protein [Kingella kingae]